MTSDRSPDGLDWISAFEAYKLVCERNGPTDATRSIAGRAHIGMIRTQAARFSMEQRAARGGKDTLTRDNAELPKEFWWAKGEAALTQNWTTGDFSTWIDNRYEWKAFGVKFARSGIEAMLAPSLPSEAVTEALHGEGAVFSSPPALPSDAAIREKMIELCEMGISRDTAAKVIRQIAGFEAVGNEHARRTVHGYIPRGRPKKNSREK